MPGIVSRNDIVPGWTAAAAGQKTSATMAQVPAGELGPEVAVGGEAGSSTKYCGNLSSAPEHHHPVTSQAYSRAFGRTGNQERAR